MKILVAEDDRVTRTRLLSLSLDESLKRVVEATREWSGGEPFDDDVSLIGVEVK